MADNLKKQVEKKKQEAAQKKKQQEAAKKKKQQQTAKKKKQQKTAKNGAAKRGRSTTPKKGAAKRARASSTSSTSSSTTATRSSTTKKGAAATRSSTTKKGAAATSSSTTKTKKGAAATSSSTSGEYDFELWQKVESEYTGFDGKYPAEIYSRTKGQYNLYFLQDHTFETNVPADKISLPPAGAKWAELRRRQFLNKTFKEGPSTYTIVELGKGDKKHHYLCRSSTGKEIFKTVGSVQNLCGKFGWWIVELQ